VRNRRALGAGSRDQLAHCRFTVSRNREIASHGLVRSHLEWGHWLLGVVLLAKGDRDAALIETQRVNVVDGRQLGLAPI
jgi:hypothetical protein